ncbi:MAG: MFS transporter [Propionibacterium sp.]|nr:MFS transporter [Propionibacterium sp.]
MADAVAAVGILPKRDLTREAQKITVVSALGTVVDYFDFSLAGYLGATVWPALFFPKGTFAAAFAASAGVAVGISYLARPFGAILFGHFGDILGRKNSLLATLVLAAIGTLGLAFAPTYAVAGFFGIVLVVLCRLLFGIAMGGEMGGAVSWITEAAEAAQTKRRGLYTGMLAVAASTGVFLAAGSFVVASTLLSKADFANWGWRVVVLLGVVAIIIAGIGRYSVMESPLFTELKKKDATIKKGFPIIEVLRERPLAVLILPWIAVAVTMVVVLSSSFLPGYFVATKAPWFSYTMVYWMAAAGAVLMAAAGFVFAYFSDALGRRPTILIALVGALVFMLAGLVVLVPSGLLGLAFVAGVLFSIPVGAAEGGFYPLYAESFPTKYRQSGAGFTYQMSNLYEAILLIVVLPAIYVAYGLTNSLGPIAILETLCIGAGIVAVLWAKETRGALEK